MTATQSITKFTEVPLDAIDGGIKERLVSMRALSFQWTADQCREFLRADDAVKEWAKLQQDSAEILTEIERTKAAVLVRMARLDCTRFLKSSQQKHHAKILGEMSDEEFGAFLDRLVFPLTVSTLLSKIKEEREAFEFSRSYRAEFYGGIGRNNRAELDFIQSQRVAAAAKQVLTYRICDSDKFTTAEVVQTLAETLGKESLSDIEVRGLTEIVHEAISSETLDLTDEFPKATKIPAVVTYLEAELGWVRVPFERATVAQLRLMLEWRREQLAQLGRAVQNLEFILDAAIEKSGGDETKNMMQLSHGQFRRVLQKRFEGKQTPEERSAKHAAYMKRYHAKKKLEKADD